MYRGIAAVIRKNLSHLFVFRLANRLEYDAIEEEVSNFINKKDFRDIYKKSTDEAYNFLYVKLKERNVNDIFYSGFNIKFEID